MGTCTVPRENVSKTDHFGWGDVVCVCVWVGGWVGVGGGGGASLFNIGIHGHSCR